MGESEILVIQGHTSRNLNIVTVCSRFNITKEKLNDLIESGKPYNGCFFDWAIDEKK